MVKIMLAPLLLALGHAQVFLSQLMQLVTPSFLVSPHQLPSEQYLKREDLNTLKICWGM